MNDRKYFEGEFKDLLCDFIEHKRALGYKYTTISGTLRRFSRFTLNYKIENKLLSKEIVLAWTAKSKIQFPSTECRSADDSVQCEIHEVQYSVPNYYVPLSY